MVKAEAGPAKRTRKYFLARVECGKSITSPPVKPHLRRGGAEGGERATGVRMGGGGRQEGSNLERWEGGSSSAAKDAEGDGLCLMCIRLFKTRFIFSSLLFSLNFAFFSRTGGNTSSNQSNHV